MRVNIVTGSVSRLSGGLYTSVRRLTENLAESGKIQVQVVGHRDERTTEDIPAWKTAPQLLNSNGIRALSKELANLLEETNPDIVHPQFIWSYASWAVVKWKGKHPNRKHIISPRGMLDPWAVKNSWWKKKLAALAYESSHLRSANCIHALCASEAKSIRAYGLRNPICVIPNGIDLPTEETLTKAMQTRANQQGRIKQQLLFIGRIHPKKGIKNLVEAWDIAQRHLKDWELIIAGWDDGGHLAEIQHLIHERKLTDSVSLPGSLLNESKVLALSKADAFILPSFSEGLPMSILEAWSYRLPVLMTQECNLPIGFQKDAALEISTSPKELANSLIEFSKLTNSERQVIGDAGYRLVSEQFQWKHIAKQMEAVYRWIIEGGEKPLTIWDGGTLGH